MLVAMVIFSSMFIFSRLFGAQSCYLQSWQDAPGNPYNDAHALVVDW